MRITAGIYKGRKLNVPKGLTVRPTTDYMRQALFNILGDAVQGAKLMDLFAGTGAIGIEALSRGAEHVTFVERNRKVISILKRNLETLEIPQKAYAIWAKDVSALRPSQAVWDILFADPPYDVLNFDLAPLAESIGNPQALLVVEHSAKNPPEESDVMLVDRRVYGQSCLSFYRFNRD